MTVAYWIFRPVAGGVSHTLYMGAGDAARYAAAHGLTMTREW